MFLSTINRNAKAFMLAIVGAEYVLNLLPRGTHMNSPNSSSPANWRTYCRSANLDVRQSVA